MRFLAALGFTVAGASLGTVLGWFLCALFVAGAREDEYRRGWWDGVRTSRMHPRTGLRSARTR